MTEPVKFFKVDNSTIYQDGFSYLLHRDLDSPKSSADLELRQSFHCALREEQKCRSRIHVTGNWEMDKKGRKFMLGIVKKGDHNHGSENRDTTRKLKFYKNDNESVHRNGFVYSLYRELDPPKRTPDFQWNQSYRCAMSDQENCRARIYTAGQWEVNKRELQYQLGIFKNCIHSHKSEQAPLNIGQFFLADLPLRRSLRRTAKALENERQSNLQQLIKTGENEKYLEIYESEEKGRGICTSKSFEKGEFVIEYKGDILGYKIAKIREEEYAQDCKIGSYMYFFKHHDQNYCVDATEETPYKGRLINHSVLKPNLKTKVVDFGKSFHLVLIAKRDIDEGEELLYDYGDRTRCTVAENPWLLNS